MNFWRSTLLAITLTCIGSVGAVSQPTFDVTAYRQFLDSHRDLTAHQLLAMHPAGVFDRVVSTDPTSAAYVAEIDSLIRMTPDERSLLKSHGFFVSERLSRSSFGEALAEIYHRDLPVFVSSDAILHALHMSYDVILKDIETHRLIPSLDTLLTHLQNRLPILAERYSSQPSMRTSLRDVDVYLTVARNLLGSGGVPSFPEDLADVSSILALIGAERPADVPLFSTVNRTVDFSQFTVRGHYTQDQMLSRYFRAMIWLGRTEMYLSSPIVDGIAVQPDSCIQRQTIDAFLLLEALEEAAATSRLQGIDNAIRALVGESDNVTVEHLADLRGSLGISRASDLLDTARARQFREELLRRSYAFQRINSQIIMTDPSNPEQIRLPSAFLLLGQRFVVDSYVMGSVVYDRILTQGVKVRRMLPSPLDVMFALGNDAAAQLLQPELERYPYGSNLAALRYLIDGYDDAFWGSTLANAWLRSIRSLNAPADRRSLPAFMRTAAWWQEKLNTQVASWAQLRHDNLLYTKQSYSGGIICSYPESYVEPIPAFYRSIRELAETGSNACADMNMPQAVTYFDFLGGVSDTLESIAVKTLEGAALDPAEREFLRSMLRPPQVCGAPYGGWYTKLYYSPVEDMFKPNHVIADVHTAPTDEFGNLVGWVLHVGTGPVNLAVVTATLPNAGMCAFIGPVMSSYEYLSTSFHRLTDEEWNLSFSQPPSQRFAFTRLYLADTTGSARAGGPQLITGAGDEVSAGDLPGALTLSENYPNPFNPSTMLEFSVPGSGPASLAVFDVLGRRVAVLFEGVAPAGRMIRAVFRAGDRAGGVYFARLVWNGQHQIRKMVLAK